MNILYINAAFRDGSRTKILAERVLSEYPADSITEVSLENYEDRPLTGERLSAYNRAVSLKQFEDPMFDAAKQFAAADEIIIAAPFWNYGIPAVLHDYLELVCTQGITFDMSPEGRYFSKCAAKKMTFITTSGGFIPEKDHAVSYLKDLCEVFFDIPKLRYLHAEGVDIYGADVPALLEAAYQDSLK